MWWRGYGLHSQSIRIPTVSKSKWAKSWKENMIVMQILFHFRLPQRRLCPPPPFCWLVCVQDHTHKKKTWIHFSGTWWEDTEFAKWRCDSILVWTRMKGQIQEFWSLLRDHSLFPHCCYFRRLRYMNLLRKFIHGWQWASGKVVWFSCI